ncbi:MAG: response regulator transcription factor [Chloroflexota bacterium]
MTDDLHDTTRGSTAPPSSGQHHVLVVEDDLKIAGMLRRTLAFEGYRVSVASDGHAALRLTAEEGPDIVVLDIMLPGMDGLEVCRRLRRGSALPVLMLTARDTVEDRVQGLDSGADDYLVKPFATDELLARLRALLRRHAAAERPAVLRYADLTLDTGTRQALRGSRPFEVTTTEYDLLGLFLRHPEQVLTRDLIMERVWGYDFAGESNVLEVYVRYLRAKLEAGGEARLLQTVRGAGYRLRVAARESPAVDE